MVLPGLDCQFSLTFIPGHVKGKRSPMGSLAWSAYSSLCPVWRSSPISPWKSGSLSPASTVTPFFESLMPPNQQAKWPGSSLKLQFNGIIVESPGGSISPSRTKTSRLAKCKVMRRGSQNFASRSLRLIMSVVNSIFTLIPGPLNPEYGEIAPYIRH